ncbi:hypothetical protein M422DRAFT_239317 [Sphaerobolus stellatus SS14]|nr:hypothetical protein M422DRAFT_239317 [Sphaerobolus stellatus SS14]
MKATAPTPSSGRTTATRSVSYRPRSTIPCVEYLTFINGIYSDSTLAFFNDVIEVNWCSTSLRYWHTLLVSFKPLQPHIPLKNHTSSPSMRQPANVKFNFFQDTQDSLKWQPDCMCAP